MTLLGKNARQRKDKRALIVRKHSIPIQLLEQYKNNPQRVLHNLIGVALSLHHHLPSVDDVTTGFTSLEIVGFLPPNVHK